MLSDTTIRKFIEEGHIQLTGEDTASFEKHIQPNSIEVPTKTIVDESGAEPGMNQDGWVLEPQKRYKLVPAFSFSLGKDLPKVLALAHYLLTDYGVIRPLRMFTEVETQELILVKSGRRFSTKEPIKIICGPLVHNH